MKLWIFLVGMLSIITTGFIVIAKNSFPVEHIPKSDYQLILDNDSIYIYDNSRRVGAFHYDSSKISIALLDDNL